MRRAVIIVLTALILIDAFSLVKMVNEEDFDTIPPLRENETYRVLDTELIPRENVTAFCVTDSAIALFYDEQGLVNVYSPEGTFLYGLLVRSIRNGAGDISFQKEYLYVKTRENKMYLFKGEELIRSFSYEEDPTQYRRITQRMESQESHSLNGETYSYLPDSNRIVKRAPQGPIVTVISMPEKNADIPDTAMFLLLLIAALAHFLQCGRIIPKSGNGDPHRS